MRLRCFETDTAAADEADTSAAGDAETVAAGEAENALLRRVLKRLLPGG